MTDIEILNKLNKSDSSMKAKWLSWKVLLDAGLTLEKANLLCDDKYYKRIRLQTIKYFKDIEFNKNNLVRFLITEKSFKLKKAIEVVGDFDIKNIYSINSFVDKYNKICSPKNCDLNWYLERGYDRIEAEAFLEEFFKKGSISSKNKCDEDEVYKKWFCKTRKNGALAASLSNKRNESKFEIELRLLLKEYGYESKDYFTPILNNEFGSKKNFVHDMFIDNCIIEYNGGYWHKDFIKFKQFSESDYLEEIRKAIYCIEFKRINKPNYIIVWENDFEDVYDAAQFIINCVYKKSNSTFYSSRDLDNIYYNKLKKYDYDDNKFLDIADDFSKKSKCVSKKVCCLIVKNGRIISSGLNGTVPGTKNCNEIFDENNFDRVEHHKFSESCEIHAEISAILNAVNNGIRINEECVVYCNLEPCGQCLKNLFALGIKRIVYRYKYDLNTEVYKEFTKYMIDCGVEIKHVKKE